MLTNLPSPYNFCISIAIPCLVNACLAQCLNSVLNVKGLVGALNQEKALVGAFSLIVQLRRLIVCSTNHDTPLGSVILTLTRLLPPAAACCQHVLVEVSTKLRHILPYSQMILLVESSYTSTSILRTPSCRELIFPIQGVTKHIFGLGGYKLRHF